MPVSITLSAEPGDSAVQVDATGLPTTGTITVTRIVNNQGTIVRGGANIPAPLGTLTLIDYEAPFGVEIDYTTVDSDTGTTTTTLTPIVLEPDGPYLSHPGIIGLQAAVKIARDDITWTGRTIIHQLIGRRDPVVTAQPMDLGSGTLTLVMVGGVPETDALINAMADGWPLLLRTPCHDIFRDGWLAVESVAERADQPRSLLRTVDVAYRRVERPTDDPFTTALWRLMDVDDTFGTLAEVDSAYDTLSDVDAGPPP